MKTQSEIVGGLRLQRIVLLCVLLFCGYKFLRAYRLLTLEDFRVYETAATLVREHRSPVIYDGADTGVDPQVRDADPTTAFAAEARKIGIPEVRLYVYPPTLADLLVPISLLPARPAGYAWIVLNMLGLGVFFFLALRLCQIPLKSLGSVALLVGIVTFDPALECLRLGQIIIILLVLWTAGLMFYLRGWKTASAFTLALATAIKLTPLIVLVPILVWRDWRWLRDFAVSVGVIGLGLLTVNGAPCLEDFFRHVLPAMSNGYPALTNRTIVAVCQNLYVSLKGGNPLQPMQTHIPHAVVSVGQAVNALCVLAAAAALARLRSSEGLTRTVGWALFAMLSVIISPVSWSHAYVLSLLALAVLWTEASRTVIPKGYLAVLVLASLELSCFAITTPLRRHLHGTPLSLMSALPVVLVVVLLFYRLVIAARFSGNLQQPKRWADLEVYAAS